MCSVYFSANSIGSSRSALAQEGITISASAVKLGSPTSLPIFLFVNTHLLCPSHLSQLPLCLVWLQRWSKNCRKPKKQDDTHQWPQFWVSAEYFFFLFCRLYSPFIPPKQKTCLTSTNTKQGERCSVRVRLGVKKQESKSGYAHWCDEPTASLEYPTRPVTPFTHAPLVWDFFCGIFK